MFCCLLELIAAMLATIAGARSGVPVSLAPMVQSPARAIW
jgi:hypothetical protein